jgi:hypothetical protein
MGTTSRKYHQLLYQAYCAWGCFANFKDTPSSHDYVRRGHCLNAVRHGLTAETVIDALEDAEDYAAFELAVTSDYDARTAVERELVLRLASLLWRLRRGTAIESGLFKIQAKHLFQFRQRRRGSEERQKIINGMCRNAVANGDADGLASGTENESGSTVTAGDPYDDLTKCFVRLSNLPTYPLDRLSRYEAALWRQACQILLTLHVLDRRKRWERIRLG